ncbi:MAG: hypothetical protein ACLFNY_01420 [Candidatus Aenigmatarchaeota archaeon]
MDEKNRGDRNLFRSMDYLSSMDFSGFTREFVDQQERYMTDVDQLLNQSSEFGKDVRKVVEETNDQYEELMDLWSDLSDMSEELVEKNVKEGFQEDIQEYNREVGEKLKELVKSSYQDAEELYSAWTKMSDSIFKGIKAGTGPDPEEITEATADFQEAALHIAKRNIEENNESLRELRETLEEIAEESSNRLKENAESSGEGYEKMVKGWLNTIDEMESKTDSYLEDLRESYLSAFEPYFGRGWIFPLFPWQPSRKMSEYESDIEDLKKKIEELKTKVEE